MTDLAYIIRELQHAVAEAHAQIAFLHAKQERMLRYGRVTDVDAKKHRYRQVVDIDEDGKEVKSAWIPYSQVAGKRKIHSAPSVGQQMLMIAVDGDHAMAFGVPMTWHDENPSPSEDGDEDIDLRGKTKRTQRDGSLKQEVDGVTATTTKQSHVVTIHKDEESAKKVDDAHPWEGNKADPLHAIRATKDGGFEFEVKIGDHAHKVKVHPENGIEHSVDGGQHVISVHPTTGIKHKSSVRVTLDAAQIEHKGSVKITGSLLAAGVIQTAAGVKAPIYAPGAPGDPGNAEDWS